MRRAQATWEKSLKLVKVSSRMMQKKVRMKSTFVMYDEDGHTDHGLIGGWTNIFKIVWFKQKSHLECLNEKFRKRPFLFISFKQCVPQMGIPIYIY